jgi:hypothetical protein
MIIRKRIYQDDQVRLSVTGPASLVGQLRRFRLREGEPATAQE